MKSVLRIGLIAFCACGFLAASPGLVEAVTFEIVSLDAPGEGFNDNTPATPVGGNTGTTIGDLGTPVWAVTRATAPLVSRTRDPTG